MNSDLFDPRAIERNRAAAARAGNQAMFLHKRAAEQIHERLSEVNRKFSETAIVTGFPDFWSAQFPAAKIVTAADVVDLDLAEFDLVVHAMSLHWANDPIGQLIQCRRALKPDGLFLGVLFGGHSLHELRKSLAEAEVVIRGGLSPRIAPMAELRDLGELLQRAGFAMPVADGDTVSVSYTSLRALALDLRAMGESNALSSRPKAFTPRKVFLEAERVYCEAFPVEEGRIAATYEMIYLAGWSPADSQPVPLRPGSAKALLSKALGAEKFTAEEPEAT